MNIRLIANVVFALISLCGFAMFTSVVAGYFMNDSVTILQNMTLISVFNVVVGLIGFYYTRVKDDISFREGFAVVSFGWISMAACGALPYYFIQDMTFVDSFFETMSGFTTTGCSIISDIESLPATINYWRHLTNWLGGMGIIVLSLAILPILGIGGMQLYKAEVPGPTSDQLTSRIANTAKILWFVYLLLSAVLFVILMILDMTWFDALCHTFSTMATGGFSTKNDSITSFSPAIKITISIFMFLAGTNFVLHIKALSGKPLSYFKDEEFRFYFYSVLILGVVIAFLLVDSKNMSYATAFTESFFQVISIMTTTGFGSNDFTAWPLLGVALICMLFFFGGSGGSTSGGMKISRILLLLKYTKVQIKQCLMPHALSNIKLNNTRVNSQIIEKVLGFFFLYILLYLVVSLILSCCPGFDLASAFSASIACLGNIGPGLSKVGPSENFAWMSDFAKMFLSLAMLVGRLELYTVLVLFTGLFWQK